MEVAKNRQQNQLNNEIVKGNTYVESLIAISPSLVLLSGHGTHLIWTLNILASFSGYKFETSLREDTAIIEYYFGCISGAIVTAGFILTIRKKHIYNFAAVLTFLVAVLFWTSESHLLLLLAGRYIAGICHGLAILTALIHASEIASHEDVRHKVILTLGIVLGLSFVVPALILRPSFSNGSAEKIIGVICLIQSILVLITNLYCSKESPSFILQRGHTDMSNEEAFTAFKIHRDGIEDNAELLYRFTTLQSYVTKEKYLTRNIFRNGNGKTLIASIAVRLLSTLAFNVGTLYYVLIIENSVVFGRDSSALPLAVIYFIGGLTIITLFNKFKHLLYYIAGYISILSIFLAVFTSIFYFNKIKFWIIFFLGFFCYIFHALYINCIAMPLDICGMISLSEAFNLSKKPFSIAFVLVIEFTVHIMFCWFAIREMIIAVWLTTIVGLFVFSVVAYLRIPRDTSKLMLEECPAAYKNAWGRNNTCGAGTENSSNVCSV